MMKKNMKRVLAVVLSTMMLISSLMFAPTPVLSANTDKPYIIMNGEPVSTAVLKADEKIRLEVVSAFDEKVGYCWQILDTQGEERWISISDKYSKVLSVSYALIGSMLDESGRAKLRCKLSVGGEEYYTDSVSVVLSYNVNESEPAISYHVAESLYASAPSLLADDADEHTTYSIVINYLFDNNAIAFEPYGASVAKGSDFTAEITSPTVVGYAPYRRVGEDYIDASVVELDYKNIQQNITINVIYEPALVNFSVHHHLQNLHDDEYSVHYDLITTSQALTGSVVGDGLALTEEQLPGFRALAYEKLTVAADGSTVIEIRYDRNYYLVDFDMNGGYGMEPVYTRYGDTVGANEPIRHGYVFDGWELVSYGGQAPTAEQISKYEISNEKTILVPDANLRYRARWITQETDYTMVFWKENANDNGYTYWGYLDGLSAMSGSYVSGQDWISRVDGIDDEQYFTFNSEKTEKNILVEGDGSTVVNVYYTRNYYTLTFKATGKCTIPVGHSHSDACYDMICGLGHVHTDDCVSELQCTQEEHKAHTEACIKCGKVEHIHGSADCTCTKTEHTHTVDCWNNVGNSTNNLYGAPSSPVDGQVYRSYTRTYYIYIKGTWYRYSSYGASSGDIVDPSCAYDEEHVHGTNCSCNVEAHSHADSCYKDTLHVHTESCYKYSCNEISHTHTDACKRLKCGITVGHSHSSTCTNASRSNTVKIVYRKYQQSLEDLWPVIDDNGVVYDDGQRWEPSSSSYYDAVLVYISKMPADDFTLTLNEATYNAYTMNYYLQVLPGDSYTETYDGKQYELHNVIKAKYNYVTKAEDFFDIAGFYQFESDPSFSNNQISISGSNRVVNFYYNRITDHVLEFSNNGIVLDAKTKEGIMYGAPLEDYNFTPDYPTNLEPNAYEFAGWYTSPGCFAGTEVDWNTLTMTEGDLMLYAKWKPIVHTIRVFLDATLTQQIGEAQIVEHKAFAYAPTGAIENGNYVFQGWFYLDEVNGNKVEKAFVFTGIPIVEDMNIYAKWSSHVSVEYKINYVLFNTNEKIADTTYGTALAGHNKTFDAKVGTDLYEGYQRGFYPLTNSHTITMSVDGSHEFTFYYVYVESMPYAVQYVDAVTGKKLCEDKLVMDNTLSVVTETFVRMEEKMPDAYQKRLILSASGEDANDDGVFDNNVITFYYNSDTEHAYYRVVHYIQNIVGDTYREYRSEENVGVIGNDYRVEALTLTGFYFSGEKTMINGVSTPVNDSSVIAKLGSEGMLIELYYKRETVNYTVRYLDSETGREIISPKIGSDVFGAQVLEYAADLTSLGYELVSDDKKLFTISANEEHNIIDFVYQETIATLKYQIVGPEDCGSLSQYSENVEAITGEVNGSVPSVAEGFLFKGWFVDAACTVEADTTEWDKSTNRLSPKKGAGSIWTDKTYYAKFLAKETELTIQTTSTSEKDEKQAFIFRIDGKEGTDTEGINVTVSVIGNSEVTITKLPVGEYTVTELTDWSWRYENPSAQREVTLDYHANGNVIVYNNSREHGKWLDGNDVVVNKYE